MAKTKKSQKHTERWHLVDWVGGWGGLNQLPHMELIRRYPGLIAFVQRQRGAVSSIMDSLAEKRINRIIYLGRNQGVCIQKIYLSVLGILDVFLNISFKPTKIWRDNIFCLVHPVGQFH